MWRFWPYSRGTSQPPPMPCIVGVARSGTTLLRLMLDAHPELAIPAETHFLPHVAQLQGSSSTLRQSFFQTVTEFPTWIDCCVDKDRFWNRLASIEPFALDQGSRAFYQLYAERLGKLRWGDKSPPYCSHLKTIQHLLPEAHFIHIVRDGRDVALSLKGLWFSPSEDLAAVAQHWRETIKTTRELAKECAHYMEVRYEDLIAGPRTELKRICRFIHLEYKSEMEQYHISARARLDEVKTRYKPDGSIQITKEERLHLHRLTSEQPDSSRIERWRIEMSLPDQRTFASVAGGMLEECGYSS